MAELNNEIFTLPNGMRLLCFHTESEVEYFGVDVNSGSRDESPAHYGLAHFVEHTIFKGTENRRASSINNRMEGVGGDLNAFTSKEETNVFSIFPKGNLPRAVDLIADLITNSTFPKAELDKEREVVRDEIDSYLDSPSEAVYDDFEDLFFAGSQLGHNILGNDRTLDGFDSATCRNYLTSNFVGPRIVAYYLGGRKPREVLSLVQKKMEAVPSSGQPLHRMPPAAVDRFDIRRELDTHQSHTVVGASLPGIDSPMCDAIALATNILGGPGMNSRLNVSLREKRGLVYTVEASTTIFSDSGLFTIYFGCDPSDRNRCLGLVFRELRKLAGKPLSPKQLAAAKRQFIGQLLVASENTEQLLLNAARSLLLRGKLRPMDEIVKSIGSITADDLLSVASMLDPSRCSILSLG